MSGGDAFIASIDPTSYAMTQQVRRASAESGLRESAGEMKKKAADAAAPGLAKEAADKKAKAAAAEAEEGLSKKRAQAAIQQRTSFGSNESNLSRSFLLRL